jgi:hypothetical protein
VYIVNQHFLTLWVDSSQHSLTMPPIALPQFRQNLKNVIFIPATAPANPPTIADVAGGIKLSHEMYGLRRQSLPQPHRCRILMPFVERGEATEEELVKAFKYETALLVAGDQGMYVSQVSSCYELTCLTLKEQSLHGLLVQWRRHLHRFGRIWPN